MPGFFVVFGQLGALPMQTTLTIALANAGQQEVGTCMTLLDLQHVLHGPHLQQMRACSR